MEPLLNPEWTEIKNACLELAEKVGGQNLEINYIVGITRGGLAPAVVLSHILGIPLIPVSYSSQSGKGDDKFYSNELPEIQSTIARDKSFSGMPNLLIVDDIADSGETMAEVNKFYVDQGHEVHTLVLYYKVGSVFSPDFYWQKIPVDSGWITFPWE